MNWLAKIQQHVEKKPIVLLRFYDEEWDRLLDSRRGPGEFTIARPHEMLKKAKPSTPCLIFGKGHDDESLYFGLISSKSAVTTFETRIKVNRGQKIRPKSVAKLLKLVTKSPHEKNLRNNLSQDNSVIVLTPKLSSYIIEKLASLKRNKVIFRTLIESLSTPKQFNSNESLQENAVQLALKAFGIGSEDSALSLDLVEGQESALVRIPVMEDSVIEHDARYVPGFELVGSDITGRAVFKKDEEILEVYTANRRPLERVFGVDLIYFNASFQNIVMLQYKMLEEKTWNDNETDWIYRPDRNLKKELQRMLLFKKNENLSGNEYRLNPQVFFLKFVKRNFSTKSHGIIIPIEHFEHLRKDPAFRGPKNGLRISYNALGGRYLRQSPFLDLIRSGYIGAHAETSKQLHTLVNAVLESDKAVVAAIQKRIDYNTYNL